MAWALHRHDEVNETSEEVFTITAAQRALSEEQAGRTRRYLISMGIRTACFLAAIIIPTWPRWLFVIGAFTLPYLAVVIANAGRENDEPGAGGIVITRPELPAAPPRALDRSDLPGGPP